MESFNKKMAEESRRIFEGRKIVFGEGNAGAKIMLIGEAPGGEEEKQGKPFVGKAGQNLNEFLEILGLERNNIYITNVVKLRPFKLSPKTNKPVNRPPNKSELEFFVPYLHREIEIVKPKLVVTLGNFALKNVTLNNKIVIGDCHGEIMRVNNIKLFPLYHPASVIYNRSLREVYIKDLYKLKKIL